MLFTSIAVFSGQTLFRYIATKGLDKIFSNSNEFETRLMQVINKTVDDYKTLYPTSVKSDKIPFYDSQKIVDELLKYRIMRSDYSIDALKEVFKSEDNIIFPQDDELERFFEVFIKNILEDEKFSKLEIDATFKEEVFVISRMLNEIQSILQKVIEDMTTDLHEEWKRELYVYKNNIEEFKPYTALKLLEELETSLNDAKEIPPDKIFANLYYLKALCYSQIGKDEEVYKNFIQAYKRNANNAEFRNNAAYSYFKVGDFEKSQLLCNEIFKYDEYNITYWFIYILSKDIVSNEIELKNIPQIILNDTNFKRMLYNHFIENSPKNIPIDLFESYNLFPNIDFTKQIIPMNFNNYKEYFFQFSYLINELLNKKFISYTNIAGNNNEIIVYLNKLSCEIITTLANSEIKENFRIVDFTYYYTNFIVSECNSNVHEMKKIFSNLGKDKDNFILIMANVLQLNGDIQEALDVIESSGIKNEYFSFFKSYCSHKLNDINKYIEYSYECIDNINLINQNNFQSIMELIFFCWENGMLEKIDSERILNSKIYEETIFQEYLQIFLLTASDYDDSEYQRKLHEFEINISNVSPKLFFYLGYIYFCIKDYISAVTYFNKYINKYENSRDTYFYLKSLIRAKTSNVELVELLKYWRNNYSTIYEFLGVEADLRQQISDWEELKIIAEKGLSVLPNEEYFLVLHIIALNNIGEKEPIFAYKDKISNLKFNNYSSALRISNVFLENEIYDVALDILYNQAIIKENKHARAEYFLASIKIPNSYYVQLDEVDIGTWVKYSNNGNTTFIEITEQSLITNTFLTELLNKRIGDNILVKMIYSDKYDTIKIELIMNKYLALLNEIIEETQSPFSGLPILSVQVDTSSYETISTSFIEHFGASGTLKKDDSEKNILNYYNYQMTFSELVAHNYNFDYMNAYYHLTIYQNGLVTCPIFYYPPNLINSTTKLALDITSLLPIFEISQKDNVKFASKFIITKNLLDFIDQKIRWEKFYPSSDMTLGITVEGIQIQTLPPDFKEIRLKHLESVVEWIKNNCEIIIVPDRLDIMKDKQNYNALVDSWANYLLDNIFLTNRADIILISDDLQFLNFIPINSGKIISTEYFLQNLPNYESSLEYLLQRKYLGLTINKNVLLNEYKKKIQLKENSYNQCLFNLSLSLNPTKQNIITSILFLKEIYLSSLQPDLELQREAVNLFVFLFQKGANIEKMEYALDLISKEFKMMGNKLNLVFDSFNDALSILNQTLKSIYQI